MSEQQRIPPKRLMVVMIAIAILAIAALSLPSELLGIVLGGENKSGRHHAVKDNAYLPGDAAESRRGHIFVDTGGSSWVESHSPRRNHSQSTSMDADQKSEGRIRISFRLHDPDTVPYPQQYLSVHGYMCPGSEPLPPTMSGRTILNFTTTISTDLNILFIGDSISQQFAQGFYSSVLDGERHIGSHYITRSFINGQVFQNSGLHVCSSLVAPARGGGVSAYWRVLELMSKQNSVEWYVNCKRDKTWWAREGERLATHRYPFPTDGPNELIKVNTNKNNGATTWYRKIFNDTGYRNVTETQSPEQQYYSVGGFDCCVLRIQHGWMELHEITRERVVEEIELCNKVVGASTVIISTLPLNNNVITSSDWEGIISLNSVIRDIARNWKPVENGLQWVLVQEFGNFTNQILWRNAEHIGYNMTVPDFSISDGWEKQGSDFLLHRYQGIKSMKHAPSIPMVCAYHIDHPFSTRNKTAGQCFFNRVSRDGNAKKQTEDIRQCEQACNDQFCSLVPVDTSWIGNGTTIYAK